MGPKSIYKCPCVHFCVEVCGHVDMSGVRSLLSDTLSDMGALCVPLCENILDVCVCTYL